MPYFIQILHIVCTASKLLIAWQLVPVLRDPEDQIHQQVPLQYSSLGNLDTPSICGLPVK